MILKKMKSFSKAKRFLTLSAGIFAGFVAVLYLVFLIVPHFIDLNKYTNLIEPELKKYTKLDFVLENPRLSTTFDLAVKISADKIALNYNDKKSLLVLNNPFIKINLPSLLFKNLNLDKIYVRRADVLLVFDKTKNYTIKDYIIEQNADETKENGADELPIKIKNINVVVDEFNFMLEDENVSKTYIVSGNNNNIHLSSLDKGPLKIKTKGYIGTLNSNSHFSDFDINFQMPLDGIITDNAPKKETQEFIYPTFNPFIEVEKFNFYGKIFTDLKITDIKDLKGRGDVKISDVTLKLKDIQLPKSYLNLAFKNDKITNDAKIFVSSDEFIEQDGEFVSFDNYEMSAKTKKISLDNLRLLSASLLDVLNIKSDLAASSATGHLVADFSVKCKGKHIKSSGKSEIKGGTFKYPAANLNVTNITSLIDFSGNKLNIKDTSLLLNGSKFKVSGEILTNSKLNISINSDPLKIADIIKLGSELKIIKASDIKDFQFNSGLLKIAVKLSGTLKNIIPDAKIVIDNFAMSVKSLKMPVKISNIEISFIPKGKDFDGKITLKELSAANNNPKMNFRLPLMNIKMNSKDIDILKTTLLIDSAQSSLDGKIANYSAKNPEIKFNLNGKIAPQTIISFVPSEFRKMIKSKGAIPYRANVTGDMSNIKINAVATTNPQNYVSVIDINSIAGKTNTLNFDGSIKGDAFAIDDASVLSQGTKIAHAKGKISSIYAKNPTINSLNVSIPQSQSVTLGFLGNAKASAKGDLNIQGSVLKPLILGNLSLSNVSYPAMKLRADSLKLDFNRLNIFADGTNIKIGNSDFDFSSKMANNLQNINISSLDFNSNYIDSDEILKILSSMPNSQTGPGPDGGALAVKSGHGTIGKIKSGDIIASNIKFDFSLKNNLFDMKNLEAIAYDGKITGNVTYHLSQLRANLNVMADNVNMRKFTSALTHLNLPMSGTADGMLKATLKGATMTEQLKSLNGQAKFTVKDGEIKDFISLENFLQASNIISKGLSNFNLNSVLSAITRKNTGAFNSVEGVMNFAGGYASFQTFKTKGPNMSMDVQGKYNLLNNYADMTVLGRVSTSIVNIMGPLGNYSINNVVDNLASQNETVSTVLAIVKTVAPVVNPYLTSITDNEIARVPALTTNDSGKIFKVIINGVATKPSAIKSFKWADMK